MTKYFRNISINNISSKGQKLKTMENSPLYLLQGFQEKIFETKQTLWKAKPTLHTEI